MRTTTRAWVPPELVFRDDVRDVQMVDAGLLILRLVVGGVFALHGARWIFGPGIDALVAAYARQAVPAPALLGAIVPVIELLGGVAIVVGVATRFSAALLVLCLVFSFLVLTEARLYPLSRGGDSMLILAGACASVLLAGGGRWSVGEMVRRYVRRATLIPAPETLT